MDAHMQTDAAVGAPSTASAGVQANTIRVNRPPNITWHRLKMNEVAVELPELPLASSPVAKLAAIPDSEPAAVANARAASMRYDRLAFWETGMGEQATEWLLAHATSYERLVAAEGERAQMLVDLDAVPGKTAVAVVDVVAKAGSRLVVNVHTDSPELAAGGNANGAADGSAGLTGITGVYVRVLAEAGAQVDLAVLQTLDAGYCYLENIGIWQADNARVEVRQTELGAGESYVGLASQLAGYRADLDVDVRYLGHGQQKLDFNYTMRSRGRKTTPTLTASGVLTDRSTKTFRDTIDLVHGCKGTVGNEQETVLLANPQVRNKSLPVILCDEDDVQGNHGATIGHVNAEQLTYLQTRGLTEEQVQKLFIEATFDYAAEQAPTERAARGVDRLARTVLGHPILSS